MIPKLKVFLILALMTSTAQAVEGLHFDLAYWSRAVTALQFQGPAKSGSCSSSLIGDHLMLTNQHCMESDEDCKNTFVEFSDANDNVISRHYCSRRLQASTRKKGEFDKPDYALFEIEGDTDGLPQLPLAPPGQDKIVAGSKVYIMKIDFNTMTDGNKRPVRAVEECTGISTDKDFLFKVSGNTDGLPCSIRSGNSGSAVLNERGQVIGVISYITMDRSQVNIEQLNKVTILDAGGTNLSYIRANAGQYLGK